MKSLLADSWCGTSQHELRLRWKMFFLAKAGQIDFDCQTCLQCEERKGVQRNKLVSRHSIVYNRLIERIRLRLVHTFVGWSNFRIFNSFKFSPSDLLCLRFSRSKYNASTINHLFVCFSTLRPKILTLLMCYFYVLLGPVVCVREGVNLR